MLSTLGRAAVRPADPIALVGMACRFPGAPDITRFWQLIEAGKACFSRPPGDRWDHDSYYSASGRDPDRTNCPTGAFLDDIRRFPALEFGLSPRRVEVMDPQQRLTLWTAAEALADAGYQALPHWGGRSFDRRGVGSFIGYTAGEFRELLSARTAVMNIANGALGVGARDSEGRARLAAAVERIAPQRAFSATGSLGNMCAAAINQELDLGGPAYTLDAACASSLLAVHDAITLLRAGQIHMALAGGVYLNLTPTHLVAFARLGALSRAGVCRPFDASADGFVQGEGVGVVVLKRLADAQRDGDRIYAVLRGSAVNNDGHGEGPMAPRADGQEAVVRAALADGQIETDSLGYLEAHGTGTVVGDRTELAALGAVYGSRAEPLVLGSVKGNIGHTMSAAGVAGLIKATLSVYQATLPPMAGFSVGAPGVAEGHFTVLREPMPWGGTTPRRAAVSSFGFGGTNVSCVLEEAPVTATAAAGWRGPELVVVSADTGELLGAHLRDLAETMGVSRDLGAVVHTLNQRGLRPVRAAIVARTLAELTERLRKAADTLIAQPDRRGEFGQDVFVGEAGAPVPVAFMCPGQGSQKVGLLADWLAYPPYVAALREVESAVEDLLPQPLTDYLYATGGPEEADALEAALTDTAVAQPAMLAVGLGVAAVLSRFGVVPSVVLGHSLGEFTASVLAGAVSVRDAARFVARRGQAMKRLPGEHGAMAAVMAEVDEVRQHLGPDVVIANHNHPSQCVIAGAAVAVDSAVARLTAAGLRAQKIKVSHAFHSPLMAGVQSVVDAALDGVGFSDPTVPMVSAIAEATPRDAAAIRSIYQRHAVSPVQFVRALGEAVESGAGVLVQLCSGSTLASFARGVVLRDRIRIQAVGGDTDGGLGLVRLLGALVVRGHPVDLSGFGGGLTPLPHVPLETGSWWPVADPPPVESVASALAVTETAAVLTSAPPTVGPSDAAALPPSAVAAARSANLPDTAPADAPVPETGVPDAELEERTLRLISRVSAYPLASLRLDQKLGADLGFDSLMLSELSTGLGQLRPGFAGLPRALVLQNPSISDLIGLLRSGNRAGRQLTQPDRPLKAWRPALRPAPGTGLRRRPTWPLRVLDQPSLETLRHLEPGDLYVRLSALPADSAVTGAIAGYVKCLAREWPEHKVVLFVGSDAEIAEEATLAEHDLEVVWQGGQRWVVGLEGIAAGSPLPSRAGQRVLVTGGTGWLGRRLARVLSAAGAEVWLSGSRPEPSGLLAELGPRARYLQLDLARSWDPAIVSGLRFDGLVHAAGVTADGRPGKADGSRALWLKVDALAALISALPGLRWVSAVGSFAGRFGNRHQTEYGAANEAMAGLLRGLARPDFVVQTMVWGPWAESDLVSAMPLAAREALADDGLVFVDTEQGTRAFGELLGVAGEVVVGLDLPERPIRMIWDELLDPTMRWLADHALFGRPTVPMAVVMERALATGARGLADLSLIGGVVVEAPLWVRWSREGEQFAVSVEGRRAWTGRIVEADPAPPAAPEGELEACPLDLATFYTAHTFHGPALRGLIAVEGVANGVIRGEVRVGDPAAWGESRAWSFSPLAVDSALQLAGLYAAFRWGRAGFPTGLRRWSVYRAPASRLRAVVRWEGSGFDASVWLLDAEGGLVAFAEGVAGELRQTEAPSVAAEHRDFAAFPAYVDIEQRLEAAALLGLENPYFKVIEGVAREKVRIDGRELLHFCGYNYLGFSGDPLVNAAVIEAVGRYGSSVSASRVASGERPIHGELEAALAGALGMEDCVVFSAGHMTNQTTIGHLFGPKDLILHDALIHDSALQGMKLAGASRRPFPHGDVAAADRLLRQLRGQFEKVLILIEGVYSMDGDLCDLPAFVELKRRHQAFLMVDEAHSFGVVGATGCGVAEHFGVPGTEVDIWMGTLSKSLASCGGYIAGTRALVRLLKYSAPGFVYSAGISPANTAAALASLHLMRAQPERVTTLQARAQHFFAACARLGLDTGPAAGLSAVVPVIVGNSLHALKLADALFAAGINVQPILYPAVPDDAARLRFFISCLHDAASLDHAAALVAATLERVRAE